jgi:AraC family transcriptional regulator of adaptative response/methylated-DNA-[protein]-cysteine methyltransferase
MTLTSIGTPNMSPTMTFGIGQSALGKTLVAKGAKGVTAILFGESDDDMRADLKRRFPAAALIRDDAALGDELAEVATLIETPANGLRIDLDMQGGTPFQQRVWKELRNIPLGETATYGQIAERIGSPKAVRAVGTACGANNLSVAIPCHRVVHGSGKQAGYHWGVARKNLLLNKEMNA